MSHEIETMMYARQLPWHGLGTYVGDAEVDSAEAIQAAGLDWSVNIEPMQLEDGTPIPDFFATVRDSDRKTFGVVKGRYNVLQNEEAFGFMDKLQDDGLVKYHTAGALFGGSRVWLLAQLPGSIETLPGDETHRFILLTNSHDGSGCVQIFPTTVRVVCANTLALAVGKRKGSGYSIRHTKNMGVKLDSAVTALRESSAQLQKYNEFSRQLAATRMTVKDADDFLTALIPGDSGKSANMRGRIAHLARYGSGTDIPGVRGTAWGMLNAVTEYANHEKTIRVCNGRQEADVRTDSVLFGSAANLMSDAVRLLAPA